MQAILISAYKDETYLKRLISFFCSDFKVFVHIDKKSEISPQNIKINNNVYVYKKFLINWGSLNHLRAIFFLMQEALKKDKNISYIHIISGSDIPVKTLNEFNKFDNCKKIYMEHFKVANLNNAELNRRYQYGTRFPNASQKKLGVRLINKLYRILNFPKENIGEFNANQLYKGLIWLSLPRKACNYVIKYEEANNFIDKMKHVTIPEEFFFQTILENSPFHANIASNNLVYNDWSNPRNGSLPAILDESDFSKVTNGTYFFARKIDSTISASLINKISNEINNF